MGVGRWPKRLLFGTRPPYRAASFRPLRCLFVTHIWAYVSLLLVHHHQNLPLFAYFRNASESGLIRFCAPRFLQENLLFLRLKHQFAISLLLQDKTQIFKQHLSLLNILLRRLGELNHFSDRSEAADSRWGRLNLCWGSNRHLSWIWLYWSTEAIFLQILL